MANKKFSEFELKTTTSNVSHIVGYNGAENVRITPANFLDTTGGPYLPLAGGTMVGNTTHNDNVKSIYGSPGNDLEIFHDGANSFIKDSGTGSLKALASGFQLLNANETQFMILADGGVGNTFVKLYFDGGEKLATTSSGISVTGQTKAGSFKAISSIPSETSASTAYLDFIGGNARIISKGPDDTTLGGFRILQQASDSSPAATPFSIDTSSNSTFSGDIEISKETPILRLNSTNVSVNQGIEFRNTGTLDGSIKHGASSADLLIDIGRNSTWGGSVIFKTDTMQAYEMTRNSHIWSILGSEKMRLDASGNLGVGATTVNFPLTVYSDTAGSTSEFVIVAGKGNDAAQFTGIGLSGYIANNGAVKSGIVLAKTTNFGVGNLHFLNNSVESDANATLADSRMKIDPNGIVTVGNRGSDLVYDPTAYQNDLIVERKNTDGDNQLATLRFNVTGYTGQTTGEASIGAVQTGNESSASLVFGTRNSGTRSEKMRIASNGDVGIGRTSPNAKLHIGTRGSANPLVPAVGDGILFDFYNDGPPYTRHSSIISQGADSSETVIDFWTKADSGTNSKKITINGAGSIVVQNSGQGIYLGGTAAANKLDDYEEGNWTPTLGGTWATDPTSITGKYTKIGQLVSIVMQWIGGAKTSSTDGYFQNLPFAVTKQGTGSVSDSGVSDRGNCLFANTQVVWLTSTTFGSGSNYLSGTYITND